MVFSVRSLLATVTVLLVVGTSEDRLMSRDPLGSSRSGMPLLCCFSPAVSLTALAMVAELHLVDVPSEVELPTGGNFFSTVLPNNCLGS